VSNLFELLVVSSEDKRFDEWIKCFEVLFNVTADLMMTDYNQLFEFVYISNDKYQYKNETKVTVGYPVSRYEWITLLPNRNRFLINNFI